MLMPMKRLATHPVFQLPLREGVATAELIATSSTGGSRRHVGICVVTNQTNDERVSLTSNKRNLQSIAFRHNPR